MNADFAKALLAAQEAMPAIEPDATNPHFKSKFVSLDRLLAKVLPVLNKHGIAVAQFPMFNAQGQATLATLLIHRETGEVLEREMLLFLPKQDPQGQGSALTYARRYALAAALGISGEKDDDAESTKPAGGSVTNGKPDPAPEPPAASKEQQAELAELVDRLVRETPLTREQVDTAMVNANGKSFAEGLEELTEAEVAEWSGRLLRFAAHAKAEAAA